ncbi:gas vesicle protein [Gandjariella thermophila]|uniref:Gas vesicle protein n=1 Tax=Gandjariella thermophila TaxID=1931992 RepID=A0A4D4J985_9PSEU|nr:gas vesicle protein [Gandjariella thermophila]GDY31570.1 hypothetical protein GTS_32030 [Gandjariella thermophila]
MTESLRPQRPAATSPVRTGIVDLLDRVVYRGAAVSGDAVISLAGVDLVRLDLRGLLTAAAGGRRAAPAAAAHDTVH